MKAFYLFGISLVYLLSQLFLKTGPVFKVPMDQAVRILPSPPNGKFILSLVRKA